MSPKVTPNFDEAIESITPGEYLCRIVSSEIKTARESGNEYVAWKLETAPKKRTVFYNTPLVGRGSGLFKHLVHCAGDSDYESGDYDTDDLTGQIVSMILTVEKITNRSGNEISVFKVKEVSEASMKQLESLPRPNTDEDIPF